MNPTPLEDPSYTPVHQPINGRAPDVVERWGPYSQLRWFDRFLPLRMVGGEGGHDESAPIAYWDRFYCQSVQHKGLHCPSCVEDQNEGWDSREPDWCCCRAVERGKDGEGRPLRHPA